MVDQQLLHPSDEHAALQHLLNAQPVPTLQATVDNIRDFLNSEEARANESHPSQPVEVLAGTRPHAPSHQERVNERDDVENDEDGRRGEDDAASFHSSHQLPPHPPLSPRITITSPTTNSAPQTHGAAVPSGQPVSSAPTGPPGPPGPTLPGAPPAPTGATTTSPLIGRAPPQPTTVPPPVPAFPLPGLPATAAAAGQPAADPVQAQLATLLQLMTIQVTASQQQQQQQMQREQADRAERERLFALLAQQQPQQSARAFPAPAAAGRHPDADGLAQGLLHRALKSTPLPKFEGTLLEFPNWMQTFQQRVGCSSLSAQDKFLVLMDHLGDVPKRKISGLSFMEASSYAKALDILQECYGTGVERKQLLLKQLYGLAAVADGDHDGLEHLVDEIRLCHQSLTQLDMQTESFDVMVPALLDKVPPLFLSGFRERRSINGIHGDPSFTEMLSALTNAVKGARAADTATAHSGAYLLAHSSSRGQPMPRPAKPASSTHRQRNEGGRGRPHRQGGAKRDFAPRDLNTQPCKFCGSCHREIDCSKYSPKQRKDIARKEGLCHNCLGHIDTINKSLPAGVETHTARTCVRGRCRLCFQRQLSPFEPILNHPPSSHQSVEIELLIGNDAFNRVMGPKVTDSFQLNSNLVVFRTPFGALISGAASVHPGPQGTQGPCLSLLAVSRTGPSYEDVLEASSCPNLADPGPDPAVELLRRCSDLEGLGIAADDAEDEKQHRQRVLARFSQSCRRLDNGRFEIRLPWRDDAAQFSSNFGPAFQTLRKVWNRLSLEERKAYNDVFRGYVSEGILELVSLDDLRQDKRARFHMHFPVIKYKDGQLKVRPVINPNGASPFNQLLDVIKPSGRSLLHATLHFRAQRYAFTADISKFYLQLSVAHEDRPSLAILLPKDPDNSVSSSSPYIAACFKRLVFGLSASPWVSQAVLDQLFLSEPLPADCQGREEKDRRRRRDAFYADDAHGVEVTPKKLQSFFSDLLAVCNDACLPLGKLATNVPNLMGHSGEELIPKDAEVGALGLRWHTGSDTLSLASYVAREKTDLPISKRQLLSSVSMSFDPLGFISPVLLTGRLLLHQPWAQECGWDDPVPDTVASSWSLLEQDFGQLSSIKLPRFAIRDASSPVRLVALGDAFPEAYGFILYAVNDDPGGENSVHFLMSRSRVAPVKPVLTLPRLELLALYMAAMAVESVTAVFKDEWTLHAPIIFTDSAITWFWYHSSKPLRSWEQRRVVRAREVPVQSVRWIPTELNVADLTTHGQSLGKLMVSRFYSGPEFMSRPLGDWPVFETPSIPAGLERGQQPRPKRAQATEVSLLNAGLSSASAPFGLNPERYSRLSTLIHITAYAQRFIGACRRKSRQHCSVRVSFFEFTASLHSWIKAAQSEYEMDTLSDIRTGKNPRKACQLNLFVDDDGLLRLKGRLFRGRLPDDVKHPVLVPRQSHLARLLVLHHHHQNVHAFPRSTLCSLRHFGFWIPQGLALCRQVIRANCAPCALTLGQPLALPPLGPVHPARLQTHRIWSTIGLDALGPMLYTPSTGSGSKTVHVLLFTCGVTRCVHLEVVPNLETASVTNALERFVNTRGVTHHAQIFLDNARSFHSMAAAVKALFGSKTAAQSVANALSPNIDFVFGVARAPWPGQGWIEALVKSVKRALKPALWRNRLNWDQLITLVSRVGAAVNRRPLCDDVREDGSGHLPLTPASFLHPDGLMELPVDAGLQLTGSKAAETARGLRRRMDQTLEEMWTAFSREYLSWLHEVHARQQRHHRRQRVSRVGEGFLLKEARPRLGWKPVRVVRVYADPRGTVRFVDVRTVAGNVVKRSISQLVPFEMQSEEEDDHPAVVGAREDTLAGNDGNKAGIAGNRASVEEKSGNEPPVAVTARDLRALARDLRRQQ